MEAVCVRNAVKSYGSWPNPKRILNNLNMNVVQGTIYGLLGASGCGKTTLLSCILGQRQLDQGDVFVFGERRRKTHIDGNDVGYMPQEIALYTEFTIRETMTYFGWISGMSLVEIEVKLESLSDLLQLPESNRFVRTLSGGQQRRVSFAVALLHDPELLILDEPTVGVDPILRQTIWQHLIALALEENKTIIITTHYIEEARQAHTIGLMRNGELLAEKSPDDLLRIYQCENLEQVFLLLSEEQESRIDDVGMRMRPIEETVQVRSTVGVVGKRQLQKRDKHVMRALLNKNFLRLWRNVGMLLFIFGLPVMQVAVFCLAIGASPTGLQLAVVNHEIDIELEKCQFMDGCHEQWLSCRFLDTLNRDEMFKITYYESIVDGVEAVKTGGAWALLVFQRNFSNFYTQRSIHGFIAENELDSSDIQIFPDTSNYQIFMTLRQDVSIFYNNFSEKLLYQCNKNQRNAESPLSIKPPVYGHRKPSFTNFMAPGIILTSIFFLAVGLTSLTLIGERSEGLLNRSKIAGVTEFQLLTSHIITQLIVMCGQTFFLLVTMLLVFGVECQGGLGWISGLVLLEGFCGMCFGFVISAVCECEKDAIQLTLGSFYPNLYLSGAIWPIEGMHWLIQDIAQLLPLTRGTTALRVLMSRGWSIEHEVVRIGFAVTAGWIVGFIVITIFILKS